MFHECWTWTTHTLFRGSVWGHFLQRRNSITRPAFPGCGSSEPPGFPSHDPSGCEATKCPNGLALSGAAILLGAEGALPLQARTAEPSSLHCRRGGSLHRRFDPKPPLFRTGSRSGNDGLPIRQIKERARGKAKAHEIGTGREGTQGRDIHACRLLARRRTATPLRPSRSRVRSASRLPIGSSPISARITSPETQATGAVTEAVRYLARRVSPSEQMGADRIAV